MGRLPKTSARVFEKELQGNAKRLMNEEMVVAVILTKLKVIQCLPNAVFRPLRSQWLWIELRAL